jgi:hypothetical protein
MLNELEQACSVKSSDKYCKSAAGAPAWNFKKNRGAAGAAHEEQEKWNFENEIHGF